MQIVVATGLGWPGVRTALDLYASGGMLALKPSVRGKKPGTGRSLTAEQEQAIRMIICDKRPEQLKADFALWSRAAVMQLIEREYGIKLHVRSVGKYLARWGFTPQKPIKKAYEQRPEAVQKGWMRNTRLLSKEPGPKAVRFAGVTKRRWSIRMTGAQLYPSGQNTGRLCHRRPARSSP